MTKYALFYLIAAFFFGFPVFVQAQENNWRAYLEQLAEEDMDEAGIENLYEELTYLENNPLNLNTITREQLERFPLLAPDEVIAIAAFLEHNRPVYTAFELRNVPQLSFNTVELILPFFYAGESESKRQSARQILANGRSELQFRLDKTLDKRAGYGEFSDSVLQRFPNRKYLGEDFYTLMRYSFRYRDKIQFGITAEKDAGEPMFKRQHTKGYDHYGIHFILRDAGRLKTLALGDYRLSFGQGLVLNNDFGVNKVWAMDNIARRTLPPKRHFSGAESGFFRGVAAVFGFGSVSVTTFYSNRRVDANLSADSLITSFKTDGLHRTPLEMSKKRNVREQVAGANVNYRKNHFQMGVSGLYHTYSQMYNPVLRNDNMYFVRDFNHLNAGVDYSYRLRTVSIAGETTLARNGAVATLNSVQYKPSSSLSFTALHRFYPVSYNAMYAQAFSEGSRVQNEHGLFVGTTFSPFRRFSASTFVDVVRFPWVRYGVDTPSRAVEYYFLGTYSFSRQSSAEIRYRYKQREKNARWPDDKSSSVLPYATQKLRLRYNLALPSGWSFRSTADMAFYDEKHLPLQNGFMFSQNVSYRGDGRISGDAYLGYFKADSFNARLYSYERNLLNTFYMPSFYGNGFRLALSARWNITPALSVSAKIGHTRYSDRETIGSGTELIDGNSRTDVFTYLRWQF